MKAYIIESGHFSKAGNFVAYSTKGERIHIYKKQIFEEFPMAEIVHRCLGIYENAQVKFPFYCLAGVQIFNSTEGTTFDRLTAIKISKDESTIKYYSLETKYTQLMMEHERDKTYYEEQLKYYTFEASDRGRRHDEYREAYERLGEKYDELDIENNSLKQSLCDLDSKCDALKAENIDLEDKLKEMTWNYEYAQSERERLELLCKELETNKFTESQKMKLKIARTSAKLAQEVLDKLIETAI
jgi:chromosome segregation ATPase